MKKIFFILCIVFLFASCKQDVDKKLKQNNDPIVETCSITVMQPQNGKITVKNKATGTELDAEALKKVAKDTQVSISLEANKGYKAVSLTIDGTTYNESSKDVTVTKNFTVSGVVEKLPPQPETYSITVTQPQNGKITVKNKATDTELDAEALKKVAKDTQVSISLEANEGYKAVSLTIDGTTYTESSKDVTVTKNFAVSGVVEKLPTQPETYSITVTQPEGGKITVKNKATGTELDAEALKKVAKDSQVSISLEANEGYKAVSLTIDGTTYTESSKDVTVTKNFAVSGVVEKLPTQPETYSITVTQPEGGKITVKNKATSTELDAEALKKVAKDTEVIITLKPIGGSKLKALIVDGVRNTIVIMKEITQQVKITKNIEIKAEVDVRYSLSVQNTEGGTIKIEKKGQYGFMDIFPSDYNSIEPNTTIRITLKANTDYDAKAIIIDGTRHEVSQEEVVVNKNLEISAEFTKKTNQGFSVTIINPEHGTITVKYSGQSQFLTGEELKNIPDGSILAIKLNFEQGYGDMQNSKLIINGEEYPFSKKYTIRENITVTGKVAKASGSSLQDDGFVAIEPKRIIGKAIDYKLPTSSSYDYKGVFVDGRVVTLSKYKIAKYETSYKLWKEVYSWAIKNGYKFKNAGQKGGGEWGQYNESEHVDEEPVTRVCWGDAIVWCNAYTEMKNNNDEECVYYKKDQTTILKNATEKDVDYAYDEVSSKYWKKGFRLPTETEWEYAARYQKENLNNSAENYGTETEPLYLTKLDRANGMKKPLGFEGLTLSEGEAWENLYNEITPLAVFKKWFNGTSYVEQDPKVKSTSPVGSKKPNDLGLYDMAGNVDEWVFDLFAIVTAGHTTNPQGGYNTTLQRVTRGGDYNSRVDHLASGTRDHNRSSMPSDGVGFRIACSS